MTHHAKPYLPAAGHDWALPFYDTMTRIFGIDKTRLELLRQAKLQSGHRVLDVGCGTGTFAVLLKRLHPETEYIGLILTRRRLNGRSARRRAPVFLPSST